MSDELFLLLYTLAKASEKYAEKVPEENLCYKEIARVSGKLAELISLGYAEDECIKKLFSEGYISEKIYQEVI